MEELELQTTRQEPVKPVEPNGAAKRWFYVYMSQNGSIAKSASDSPASIIDKLGSAAVAWVDYVTDSDFDRQASEAALQFGFSQELISSFTGKSRATYEDFDSEMGMKLPAIQVRGLDVQSYPLILLIRKTFVLSIHPIEVDRRFIRVRRYAESVLKRIPLNVPAEDRITMVLMRLIDEDNDRNFEHLRQIEERGDRLNELMTDPSIPRAQLGPEIYHIKHALITYLDALWHAVDVLHALRYGDAQLITDDPRLLDRLGLLGEDVNRQIGLAEHMSEVLASGLEVLQSIYNNELQNLNNRLALVMTYLTIVGTAVLVPNTLATILGNAVFNITPADLWWYLILMVGSTLVATILVYLWVRKMGWIPKKMG